MHRLILMRHAKSDWNTTAKTDFDRPLTTRGIRDVPRMADWLRRNALMPNSIACSSAVRTRQTAELLTAGRDAMGDDAVGNIEYHDALYHAGQAELLRIAQSLLKSERRVMIIGHNPGLDGLLRYLCGRQLPYTNNGKLMTTAAIAVIGLAGFEPPAGRAGLNAGAGRLEHLVRPKSLEN